VLDNAAFDSNKNAYALYLLVCVLFTLFWFIITGCMGSRFLHTIAFCYYRIRFLMVNIDGLQFQGDHKESLYWGTYRPNVYLGIRARCFTLVIYSSCALLHTICSNSVLLVSRALGTEVFFWFSLG
jgi:hypothetical protein